MKLMNGESNPYVVAAYGSCSETFFDPGAGVSIPITSSLGDGNWKYDHGPKGRAVQFVLMYTREGIAF